MEINLRTLIFNLIQNKKKELEISQIKLRSLAFTVNCLENMFEENIKSLEPENYKEMLMLLRDILEEKDNGMDQC